MSTYQQRYWELLKDTKTQVVYLQYYAVQSEKIDKFVNIFLAITSSSSIAAWAIWQQYQFIWAVIIALSQIITAIKPLLPFKKRLLAISLLNNQIQIISLSLERHWYNVAEGELSDKEIHDLTIDLKEQKNAAEIKALHGMTLPKSSSLLANAEKEADIYLRRQYFPNT